MTFPSHHSPSSPHADITAAYPTASSPASSVSSRAGAPSGTFVVTIDGPGGTGKSSVARRLARHLGFAFLDTGAMYRAATAVVIDRGLDPADHEGVVRAVRQQDMHFDFHVDPPQLISGGRVLTDRLRDKDVEARVSEVSKIGELRRLLVGMQQNVAFKHPRLVTEGRDQGSVVFPAAQLKFYLDAEPRARAARRVDQLRKKGIEAVFDDVLADLSRRDHLDSTRADAPLKPAEGAQIIDTTSLSEDEVVALLAKLVTDKLASGSPFSPAGTGPGRAWAATKTGGLGGGGTGGGVAGGSYAGRPFALAAGTA